MDDERKSKTLCAFSAFPISSVTWNVRSLLGALVAVKPVQAAKKMRAVDYLVRSNDIVILQEVRGGEKEARWFANRYAQSHYVISSIHDKPQAGHVMMRDT